VTGVTKITHFEKKIQSALNFELQRILKEKKNQTALNFGLT
jgi:hypothetical protein